MNTPPKLGQIGQISRSVEDIEQAATWYGNVLGLRHLYTFGKLAFFDCGGPRLFSHHVASEAVGEMVHRIAMDS